MCLSESPCASKIQGCVTKGIWHKISAKPPQNSESWLVGCARGWTLLKITLKVIILSKNGPVYMSLITYEFYFLFWKNRKKECYILYLDVNFVFKKAY